MRRIADLIIKGGKGREEEQPAIGLFPIFGYYIRELVRYVRRRRARRSGRSGRSDKSEDKAAQKDWDTKKSALFRLNFK
jgi:hypothetical protein